MNQDTNQKPIKLFITYAHADAKYKQALEDHLAVMKRNGEITTWDDNQILPGDKWESKIVDAIADSDILLYLTSADSLASENCNKELAQALERDKILIPIILKPCDWEGHRKISELQVLPSNDQRNVVPVCEWKLQDKAWKAVTDGIRAKVKQLREAAHGQATGQASETNKSEANRWFNFGNTLLFLQQFEQARDAYDEAIRLNPQYADAYHNRGLAKGNLSDYQGAIEDFNKTIALNPKFTEAYSNRGLAKGYLGNYHDAISDYNKALAFNPQFAEVYSNRGLAKSKLGDYQGAIEDYNKALAFNPQFAETYNNRGAAKFNLGDHHGAIEDYNQAIAINPQYANAYYNRGNAKGSLGNFQGAIEDYNQAIDINPQYAIAYYNRALVYLCIKNWEKAKSDLNEAIRLGYDVAAEFNRSGGVAEFEQQCKVKFPADIVALLKPPKEK